MEINKETGSIFCESRIHAFDKKRQLVIVSK